MCLGVGAFVDAHDPAFLIDPNARGHIDQIVKRTDLMIHIDKRCVSYIGIIIEMPGSFFTASVLRDGYNFKIFRLEFFVNGLPHGHVVTTSSPRGPGEQQYLLASKV